MRYPSRGLPERQSDRAALVAIDGTAGAILEPQLRRAPEAVALSDDTRAALEQCEFDLAQVAPSLSGEAARYFGRLSLLIREVLARNE